MSISLVYLTAIKIPIIKNGIPAKTYDQLFIANDPICHIVIAFKSSLHIDVTVVNIALVKSDNTIPANITVLFESPLSTLLEKIITAKTVKTPHKNPIIGIAKFPITGIEIPRTMYIPTPREAPDETPRVYGDANGFFNIDWILAPLTAREAPPPKANNTLGN